MATKSDFNLQQDGYVSFDAISLKDLIIERMNEQQIFTDQNYEGSNLSALIDIIAYSYHVLIYYLNKNSSESNFSQAEIYENINQIVKSIDYSPTGPQTSNLSFQAVANSNLAVDFYTIPRYSYFSFGGTSYSFTQDVSFQKTVNGVESLVDLNNNTLLYNGQFVEYPLFTALGENFETVTLAATDENIDFYIDNNNIDVYVKDNNQSSWVKWERTTSLYLENSSAKKYSVRYNEDEKYELKFGNNITGKRLTENSLIAIYYLKSDGQAGQVSKNTINNQPLYFYNTTLFNEIKTDVIPSGSNIISIEESANLVFSNDSSSTNFKTKESVEEIKQNAPRLYNSQYRLVTTEDYKNYINKNFSNWINSVEVVDNNQYINGYQNYFFNIGLQQPNADSRVLFNQLNFSNSTNFNNVYVFAVPNKNIQNSLDLRTNYLSVSQKNALTILLDEIKISNIDIVVSDPVYTEINFGASNSPDDYLFVETVGDESYLYVEVERNARRDLDSVKDDIITIFHEYFENNNMTLNQLISLKDISQSILDVEGVSTFSTRREHKGQTIIDNLLSFIVFNPIYPDNDFDITKQDIKFKYFQFGYFKNLQSINDKIQVIRQS